MSTGCRRCFYVLWIAFQLAVTYLGPAMTIVPFEPYVSEFEFASHFHPSKNPECLEEWSGDREEVFEGFPKADFAPLRSKKSLEKDLPVGEEPSIEVRAVLARCFKNHEETNDVFVNRDVYNITAGRSQDILDFHGFDRDEPARHSEVRDCRRKLIITMKFNNIGRTKTQEEFVVIDHVLDPVTMHKSRLLNPFVIKVRQEPVLQLYALKFQGVVNAEAKEEVINKKHSNYTGCDDFSENPTCGQMFFEGQPIQYSQGFCCSCDPELNNQREDSLWNQSEIPPSSSYLSKVRDNPIGLFKSRRSADENFFDSPSDFDDQFQSKGKISFDHNFDNLEENHSIFTENSQKDETDLVNLKHSNPANSSSSSSSGSRSKGNVIVLSGSLGTQLENWLSDDTGTKFRSFYPKLNEVALLAKTVIDDVTVSESIGRKNQKHQSMNDDESNSSQVFYDPEVIDVGPKPEFVTHSGNVPKKSLENVAEKNNDLGKFPSNSKSAAKRTNYASQNHRLSNRSADAVLDKSPEHDKVMKKRSSTLKSGEGRKSGKISDDDFRIEPSGGWKEKMELLKLKKQADVLKEYLNWRQDIVPPDHHGIYRYTTKISMTNDQEETSSQFKTIAAQDFNALAETPLPDIIATCFSPSEKDSSTNNERRGFTTKMSSNEKNYVTKGNKTSTSSYESTSTSSGTRRLGDWSMKVESTTIEMEATTGYLDQEAGEKVSQDKESTGRILPPCCPITNDVTNSTELQGIVGFSDPLHLSKTDEGSLKLPSDQRGQLSDLENDLVIISVMENNELTNKKVGERELGETYSSRSHLSTENNASDFVSHHRRYKSKVKRKYKTDDMFKKAGRKRRAGRQLMSVEDRDYRADEDDLMFGDKENINVESTNGFIDDTSQNLKDKWNQLIDKVIPANSSGLWKSANTSESSLLEEQSLPGNGRSVMRELHFDNAEECVKQMAKKIVNGGSIHVRRRKLTSHPNSAGKTREIRTKDNESDSEDYQEPWLDDDNSLDQNAGNSQLSSPELRDLNASPEIKIIKIIPLDVPKLSPLRKDDTKSSRMTASQLPKMEDDLVPGTTVQPGKIRPSELQWQKNEDNYNKSPDEDMNIGSSGSCSPGTEPVGRNLENDAISASPVNRVFTNNPTRLKVIGLLTVEQPFMNETKSPNGNRDPNYEVRPLIDAKTEQQPDDRENYIHTVRPDNHANKILSELVDCAKIERSKSPQHSHDMDSCSCSDITNDEEQKKDIDYVDQQDVGTAKMDNNQELGEPNEIGSSLEHNHEGDSMITNIKNNKLEHIHPKDEFHSCNDDREITTSPRTSIDNVPKGFTARQNVKMKNMLAIMEFMKKLSGMITGKSSQDMVGADNDTLVINIASFVKPSQLDQTTDIHAMVGENKNYEGRNEAIYNGSQSKTSDRNDTPLDVRHKINDRLNSSNGKAIAENQDKSFLFYGKSDNIGAAKQATLNGPKYHDTLSSKSRHVLIADHPEGLEEQGSSEVLNDIQPHNDRIVPKINEPEINEPIANKSTSSSFSNPNDLPNNKVREVESSQEGNELGSPEGDVLQSLQRRLNARILGLKRDNRERCQRDDVILSTLKKERSVVDDGFPSIPIMERRHLRPGLRDSLKAVHRSRSLTTGEDDPQLGNQKFRRLATGKGVPKGNRRRKKKKRKKKKKRRKKMRRKKMKKKHKKKGKDYREVDAKGKPWPFGRQLMSLSEQRELASGSNFDLDETEGMKAEENRNREINELLETRRRRKVHRAKFSRGKKKKIKKRRKHKKPRMKKRRKVPKSTSLRSKRQIGPGGTQVRGGQDCLDRTHPSDVDPTKYHESAHCLRFSDLWYSVYELESPIIEHTVYLQLFEKHTNVNGVTHWEDLTQGSMVRMGTFTRHQRDGAPTIVFTYSGARTEPQNRASNLNPTSDRLLVPSPISPKKASNYPEVKASGSGEYLVVKASAISRDGNECDKAGVGFAAFTRQQDRCGRTRGSCLKNQPLAYWRHDMDARESGRPGCYFLSNFASVPTKPIKYNVSGSGSREYLGLEYLSTHVSAIDIEVRTDYNAIVRVGSSGRVSEVHVDSSGPERTVVTVVISNMGLASSPYQPRIVDCPMGLPVSWSKAKGIMQVIPPQHDQRVTLDLYGRLSLDGFHCSVEVVNHRDELVAMRRIRVQRMDRCFCVWHCLCACIGSANGMGCRPMSPEHYHAAGFQGPVPVVTIETSTLVNAVKNIPMFSAMFLLLLLILGMLKWLVGMCVPTVGRWGLDAILKGSRLETYLEPELRCRCVMTDEDGWPVHPDTGQRTVRICSRKLEFILNLIFFLTYPIAVCCSYFKRSLNSSGQRRCCFEESKMCLINEKGSCPKMIRVSTYGDSRDSNLEAEDTKYVMNELKKSQESLQNPRKMKPELRERRRKA